MGFSLFRVEAEKKHFQFFEAVISAMSTLGTTLSDYMDRSLGLGYANGAAIFISLPFGVLAAWRGMRGTALGDFLSDETGLGFLGSWLLTTGVLAEVLGTTLYTRVSRVLRGP